MKDTLIHLQVFFEIAMSIGNSLDLSQMLQNSLSTYLGKLNCSAGAVFEGRKDDEDGYINDLVFSIPRRIHMTPVFSAVLHKIPPYFSNTDFAAFIGKLPIVLAEENNYVSHILNLPGFGFLILLKAKTQLEDEILQSLKPINQKLADSCRACMQNEKINQLVRQLQAEIDERAKIEEALRESHDRFLTVMDSIDATVYVADIESHEILYMNRNMAESFGDNVEGELCYQIFRGNPTPCDHCTNPLLLDENGEPTGVHIWEDRNPLTEKWYINYDRAIKWVDGKWVRLQIATDITLLKELQEKQTKAEAQLLQSQKMESIGTLAGGVAHEINNPINGIMNYAQLIIDKIDPDNPVAEFAGEIIHETERVATIVRNLLTFAREEKETQHSARLKDIIDNTMSLIQTVFKRDQILLGVDVPEDLPKIQCRSQQIQQVIMNLAINARDALNERYPGYDEKKLIKITSHLFQKEGKRWIRTTVEDHGVGIISDIKERIFDPFFTTKDRAVGTGLGLSISYSIVKAHHGELSSESDPGEYTRFHMDLPVDNRRDLEKNGRD